MAKPRRRVPVKPVMLTIDDAATYSGEPRSKLYELAAAGRLKVFKSGRRTLISVASLDAHIASLPPAQIGKAA